MRNHNNNAKLESEIVASVLKHRTATTRLPQIQTESEENEERSRGPTAPL